MSDTLIDNMLSDDRRMRRLEQLETNCLAWLARIRDALDHVYRLVPPRAIPVEEPDQLLDDSPENSLSPSLYCQFADALCNACYIVKAEGCGKALEAIAQLGHNAENRDMKLAAALIDVAARTDRETVIEWLGKIGQFHPDRDPHAPHRPSQSEIWRYFRELQPHFLDVRHFPELAEALELQWKVFGRTTDAKLECSATGAEPSSRVESVADRARQMAARFDRLPDDVVASFALADPSERATRLRHIEAELSFGMLPVISWLEQTRPADKAELAKRRLFSILEQATMCAQLDIPEYVGGTVNRQSGKQPPSEGARRTAEMLVTARAFATTLRDWANEMEADDAQGQPPPAQQLGDAMAGKELSPPSPAGQEPHIDPFACPDCGAILPPRLRVLKKVPCQNCDQSECKTGVLVAPSSGPPGTPPALIAVHSPYWMPKLPSQRNPAGPTVDSGATVPEPMTNSGAIATKSGSQRKGKLINERMMKKLQEDRENCLGWSARDWADHLGCSKSTVHGTKTWKMILAGRKFNEAERLARQKKPRRVDRRQFGNKRPED